jgi:hypothetical protein
MEQHPWGKCGKFYPEILEGNNHVKCISVRERIILKCGLQYLTLKCELD